MEIISTELRLKDIEWVEKSLEVMKKGKPLTNTSLADKAKKEEIAVQERILDLLKVQNKDVRKGDWNNKEVSARFGVSLCWPVLNILSRSTMSTLFNC